MKTERVTFTRLTRPHEAGPVLKLIREAPLGELPFGPQEFGRWAARGIRSHNTLVALGRLDQEPVGFLIAFAPWELDSCAWVQQAYIAPQHRGRMASILQRGIELARHWARACGADHLAFETERPAAWIRLLSARVRKTRVEVAV